MDNTRLLNQIRSTDLLSLAFRYVIRDRRKSQFFFDPIETTYAVEKESQIIEEAQFALSNIESYEPSLAYAYFPHKTSLCYRRMIQLPIKDQVIRYAIATVFGDILDQGLIKTCFANRRAKGDNANRALLEEFGDISWPGWCEWQKEQKGNHNCMLKTDIAAFYDSVSHVHLTETIARALGISTQSPLMLLFQKCLKVPVESYTFQTTPRFRFQTLEQGLIIGCACDSIFANIYLKEIDEAMNQLPGIEFGRYNDDMRIFGKDRSVLLNAMKVLQEMLLSKGLNLNSAKTLFAEGSSSMDEIVSRELPMEVSDMFEEDQEDAKTSQSGTELEIDKNFKDSIKEFQEIGEICDDKSAKEFLKYLQNELESQCGELWQIEGLKKVLFNFPGAGKHGAWILVLVSSSPKASSILKQKGGELILEIMSSLTISPYIQYRVLYHLLRPNYHPFFGMDPIDVYGDSLENNLPKDKIFRILSIQSHKLKLMKIRTEAKTLIPEVFNSVLKVLPKMLGKKSNELDLMIVFCLIISSKDKAEVFEDLLEKTCPPFSSPLTEAIQIVKEIDSSKLNELWNKLFASTNEEHSVVTSFSNESEEY